MIEIQELKKRFGEHEVLKGISFVFQERGLYVIEGKSGSGKTTLLTILGGMEEDYEGSVKVFSKELSSMTEKEKEDYRYSKISFVFQDFCSKEEETLEENLMKILDIQSLSQDEKQRKIDSLLSLVGLKDKKKMTFQDLSGGEKKRASLVRGLLKDTPILLLDEPVASLNENYRAEVEKLLLRESEKRLVIYITHEIENLPEEANVLTLIDGRLTLAKQGKEYHKASLVNMPLRKKVPFQTMFRSSLMYLKSHLRFTLLTLFSFIISLFAISFSFELSMNISNSLIASLSSYMESDCMVLSSSEDGIYQERKEAKREVYDSLVESFPEDIIATGEYFITPIDEILKSQGISILYQSQSVRVKKLSLQSFLSASLFEEEGLEMDPSFQEEDVALLLSEDILKVMFQLLNGYQSSMEIQKIVNQINTSLINQNCSLYFKTYRTDWSYECEYSFPIKKVFLGEQVKIITANKDFPTFFVSKVLHFQSLEIGDESKVPWTLYHERILRLFPDHNASFLASFLKDSRFDSYTVALRKEEPYYQEKDSKTHNRVSIYTSYQKRVSYADVEKMREENSDIISHVEYSTPVYTQTANGLISGFTKPFFFSKYKDELNMIQDENCFSDVDFGSFQSSVIEVSPHVLKADLLSSASNTGITFQTLQKDQLCYGREPVTIDEIVISEALAKELFQRETDAIEETLYSLALTGSSPVGEMFQNKFLEGSFTIVGIQRGERYFLAHESLFPLCYFFQYGTLSETEISLLNAVLKVDLEKNSVEYYQNLVKKYGDYKGEFPLLEMVQEVKKTLRLLSSLFFLFALFSLVSSAFLLGMSMSLLLIRDKKNIGVLLSFGYRKKEIAKYYLFLTTFLSLIASLFSLLLSFFTDTILKQTLVDLLNIYQQSLFPYLLSLFFALSLSFSIFLFLRKKIKKLSPKDALKGIK